MVLLRLNSAVSILQQISPPPLVVLLQACASDEQKKEVTQSWGVPALPWGLCWVYWDLKARTGFTWGAQGTSQRRSLGHRSLNEKQTRSSPGFQALCVQWIFF